MVRRASRPAGETDRRVLRPRIPRVSTPVPWHDFSSDPRRPDSAQLRAADRARAVVLSTGRSPADLEAGRTHWTADVGGGVLAAGAQSRPSQAVARARAMSRTAWSYASRVAWLDTNGAIEELPALDSAY